MSAVVLTLEPKPLVSVHTLLSLYLVHLATGDALVNETVEFEKFGKITRHPAPPKVEWQPLSEPNEVPA